MIPRFRSNQGRGRRARVYCVVTVSVVFCCLYAQGHIVAYLSKSTREREREKERKKERKKKRKKETLIPCLKRRSPSVNQDKVRYTSLDMSMIFKVKHCLCSTTGTRGNWMPVNLEHSKEMP